MTKLDILAKIALNEAPISSYLKAAARTAVSPAAYAKGAANVLRGAQKGASVFKTSTQSLQSALGGAAGAAANVAGGLTSAGRWLKDPGAAVAAAGGKKSGPMMPQSGNRVDILFDKKPYVGKIRKAKETKVSNVYYVRLQNRIPQTNNMISDADGLIITNLKAGGAYTQPLKGNKVVGTFTRANFKGAAAPGNWILRA